MCLSCHSPSLTQCSLTSSTMESLNQSYPVIICFCSFALLLLLYTIPIPWKRRRDMAPEPSGAWPLIGHLPLLMGHTLPQKTLGALADKYGPVYTIRLGLRKVLVINSWEAAKDCFTTNDKAFAHRPSSVALRIMGYNNAILFYASYGPYWREVRRIAILELLSNRRIELIKHIQVSEVDVSMRELYKMWQAGCTDGGYSLVEMKQWFIDINLNMIVRMVVGERYFGTRMDDDGIRFQKAVHSFFHLVGLFVLSDAVPFLGWLDFRKKEMKRTAKELDRIMQKWLDEHKQKKLAGGAKGEQDFMDMMLSVLEDKKLPDFDADTINKAVSMNMIFGGVDTITVGLTWTFSLLINNPRVLKKAQDEIEATVGKHRPVGAVDVEKLVYLQAIVKESLRLYPPSPMPPQHLTVEDCTVAGYHVPAGTCLVANIWKIQRDPRVWSDPCEFQPERFLGDGANVDLRGKNFEFIPFGAGRRQCPGISYALQVLNLVLARLLQGFDFKTKSNQALDMTESPGLTNMKATPIHVFIAPRLPSDLY